MSLNELWSFPEQTRLLASHFATRDDRIPVPACSGLNSSAHPVEQLTVSLTNVSRIMEGWKDITQMPADVASLKAGLLHNANNNASSGTWRGLKSPSLASAVSQSKLSYLERVVLEIVESERMYVRDLRSIVEVSPSATHPS